MLVLVRRKEDGLFFTNKAGRWYRRTKGWTANPSECKPFANEQGARWSFYSHEARSPTCPHYKDISYVNWRNQQDTYRKYSSNCPCEKSRKARIRKRFDDKYEIVPVKMEVKL